MVDDGDGTLSFVTTYYDAEGEELNNLPTLTNHYAAAGSLAITAEKQMNGMTLTDGQFTFKLQPVNGAPLVTASGEQTELSVTNLADGTVTFPEILYTEADVDPETHVASYQYKVFEVTGTDAVTYDETIYTIDVTVSDEDNDGVLDVTPVINGGEAEEILFVNEYDTVDIGITKVWVDNNNIDGLRPESITYNLMANGEKVATATVTESNGWQAIFTGFPKYDAAHVEIEYTVTEDEIDFYAAEIDMGEPAVEGTETRVNVTVTNTIQLGDLTVKKMLPVADYQPAFGEAIFSFKVQASFDEDLFYTVPLQIDDSCDIENVNGTDYYVTSRTLKGLPVGVYTVTEEDSLRYELVSSQSVSVMVYGWGSNEAVMVATFVNALENDDYLSYATAIVNEYNAQTGEYEAKPVNELGDIEGNVIIHGSVREIETENVETDPFESPDALPVQPTEGENKEEDEDPDDDPDGGNDPDNANV